MEKSKSIAGIVGPTLIVMTFSEIYDTQIIPLIYLNGVLLFIAGLAIDTGLCNWLKESLRKVGLFWFNGSILLKRFITGVWIGRHEPVYAF